MSSEIMVAIISFCGMVVGSISGMVISAKLTNFRLAQLEKKVEKHNSLIERMYAAETDIKALYRRVEVLEGD
jgi:ABC-type lipoprotein release transport system permease subunit